MRIILLLFFTLVLFIPVFIVGYAESSIPSWIKNNAKFWANGDISDNEFITAIQWLIDNNILKVNSDEQLLQTDNKNLSSDVRFLENENKNFRETIKLLEDENNDLKEQLGYYQQDIPDDGDFIVVYHHSSNSHYEQIREYWMDTRYLDDVANNLNDVFNLPFDIGINVMDCDEINAFYQPSDSSIVLCYELLENIDDNFATLNLSNESWEELSNGAAFFVLAHEMGHALIDVYGLPTVGKEEDAADQFATIILLETHDKGQTAVNGGARLLYMWSQQDEMVFWDTHSLDIQRVYSTLCWAYGFDPDGNSYLIENGYLPIERAESCEYEYYKMNLSWTSLLSPYLKSE